MVYKIKVTDRAEKQIENAIQYLAVNIKSMQAANNLMEVSIKLLPFWKLLQLLFHFVKIPT